METETNPTFRPVAFTRRERAALMDLLVAHLDSNPGDPAMDSALTKLCTTVVAREVGAMTIHAVPHPYDGLTAVCGQALDGVHHTGQITPTSYNGHAICAACKAGA